MNIPLDAPWIQTLRLILEVAATVAFALSGVMAAARKRLDAVGVCVVAFVAAFGGGLVSVTVTGKGEMKGLRIDPSLMKPEEVEIVEDLIVAAFADAKAHVDAIVADRMQAVAGKLPLPPGFKLPF